MHNSLLPYLLITCFLTINPQSSVCAADTVEYTNCSQPIICGGVTSTITYPFWGANRPDYCGKSGYEVTCNGNASLITMGNINFRILGMSDATTTPTVQVAREDYYGTICPAKYVNTTIDFSLFSYSAGLSNVTFYSGCNTTLGTSATSCNDTITVSYLTATAARGISNAVDFCVALVLVPVNATASAALETGADIQTAIDGGFELNVLNIDSTLCNECVASGGVCGQTSITDAKFKCFCQADSSSTTICTESVSPPESLSHRSLIVIIVGISSAILGVILAVLCFRYMSRKKMIFTRKELRIQLDVDTFIRNCGLIGPKQYSYADLVKMTNSFKDQIGKGGFGTVYKGKLPDGMLVAVKVLNESKGDGEDFINEVASIGRTSHVNVVTLLGFCYQRNRRALVYEYMPNGSLDKFILNQGSKTANCHLEWKTLSEIAVGVARGLEYLHRGCNTRILHFDIKPQNILLDKDFCPKISDFGLAKLCKTRESIVSMVGTRGTAGYIAPEVFSRNFGGVSHKSDVYSYGMLVLEMVGARRNSHAEGCHTSEMFPHYVYKDLELANDESIFREMQEEQREIVRKMILISLGCIQTLPSDRPSMTKVVEMLEGPLHSLVVPPKPFLFSPKGSVISEQTSSHAEVSVIISQVSEAYYDQTSDNLCSKQS